MVPFAHVGCIWAGTMFQCIAGARRRCSDPSRITYVKRVQRTEDGGQRTENGGRKVTRRKLRQKGNKMSEKISSFKDLRVYKLAFEVQQEIFETSKRFPAEERYALTDQIRRASRSIGANLAEAWQKRRYVAHFVSKLTDADGEQAETQHWLDTATACGYVPEKDQKVLLEKGVRIGQMLGTMMAKPEKFCQQRS